MAKEITRKDNMLAIGATLLLFGLLYLVDLMGFFSLLPVGVGDFIMDWRNFFVYAGILFLILRKEKTFGIILIVIGLLFRLPTLFNWLGDHSKFVLPALLIVLGAWLLIISLKRR